jgi:hypothetical protein
MRPAGDESQRNCQPELTRCLEHFSHPYGIDFFAIFLSYLFEPPAFYESILFMEYA